jgi:hypothetical protein
MCTRRYDLNEEGSDSAEKQCNRNAKQSEGGGGGDSEALEVSFIG